MDKMCWRAATPSAAEPQHNTAAHQELSRGVGTAQERYQRRHNAGINGGLDRGEVFCASTAGAGVSRRPPPPFSPARTHASTSVQQKHTRTE